MRSFTPHDTVRSDADERSTEPSAYRWEAVLDARVRPGHELSPLARAALANGVAFDDVYEYEQGARKSVSQDDQAPWLAEYNPRRVYCAPETHVWVGDYCSGCGVYKWDCVKNEE